MINNTKKLAELQLNKHRQDGSSSKLSIIEVAKLMDVIKNAESMKEPVRSHSIFHSIAYN